MHGYYVFQNGTDFIDHGDPIFITFVRDPLLRAISLFYYKRQLIGRITCSLYRYLVSDYSQDSYEALEATLPIMFDEFDFIGKTETLSGSLAAWCKTYGLKQKRLSNIYSVGRYLVPKLGPKVEKRFRALHKRDYEIYKLAKEVT
jgi:hypothetical protein